MNRIFVLVTVLASAASGVLLTGIPIAGVAGASQNSTVAGEAHRVPDAGTALGSRLDVEPQPPTF